MLSYFSPKVYFELEVQQMSPKEGGYSLVLFSYEVNQLIKLCIHSWGWPFSLCDQETGWPVPEYIPTARPCPLLTPPNTSLLTVGYMDIYVESGSQKIRITNSFSDPNPHGSAFKKAARIRIRLERSDSDPTVPECLKTKNCTRGRSHIKIRIYGTGMHYLLIT